jgi:hypothetical protein
MDLIHRLDGYLYDEVAAAEKKLQIELSPHSKMYILDLLGRLARSDDLFAALADDRPLASIMLEAMHKNIFERIRDLRLIGDLSLVFSGLYPEHLTRRLVDVDYFISLGRRSYCLLSETCREYRSRRELAVLYFQLFSEFIGLTEVLTEMAETMRFLDEENVEKAARRWRHTRIRKYLEILSRHKVVPM